MKSSYEFNNYFYLSYIYIYIIMNENNNDQNSVNIDNIQIYLKEPNFIKNEFEIQKENNKSNDLKDFIQPNMISQDSLQVFPSEKIIETQWLPVLINSNSNQLIKIDNGSKSIQEIFNKNKMEDLQKFIYRRNLINNINIYLSYFYYIVQSIGIFTTTVATTYNNNTYVLYGVSLNIVASLIHSFEKKNEHISKILLDDIIKIKNNIYVDENVINGISSNIIEMNEISDNIKKK